LVTVFITPELKYTFYAKPKTRTKTRRSTRFEQVFKECGTGFQETDISLFKKMEGGKHFRIPSFLAVKKFNEFLSTGRRGKSDIQRWLKSVGDTFCSHIKFDGVPSAQYRATRFRGYECSMLVFVEADQLASEDLDLRHRLSPMEGGRS
jgi:hypothetical protein